MDSERLDWLLDFLCKRPVEENLSYSCSDPETVKEIGIQVRLNKAWKKDRFKAPRTVIDEEIMNLKRRSKI
jgi:hypothetical protein